MLLSSYVTEEEPVANNFQHNGYAPRVNIYTKIPRCGDY